MTFSPSLQPAALGVLHFLRTHPNLASAPYVRLSSFSSSSITGPELLTYLLPVTVISVSYGQ